MRRLVPVLALVLVFVAVAEAQDAPPSRTVPSPVPGIGQPRSGWFLLAHEGKRAEVATGTLKDGYGWMRFERRRGGWRWTSSGGCEPRAVDGRIRAVTWGPAPGAPLAPDTTRIPVLVNEDACSSGRDARGRILSPLVHYGADAVTVTYFVRPLTGGQDCEDTGPTPATLVLDQPLAGRRLVDGGPYPARPR